MRQADIVVTYGSTTGVEAAFAGNEFIAVLHLADRDGLEETFRTNRFGQFLNTSLVELAARLTGIRHDGAEWNLNECQAGSDGRGSRHRGRCYGLGNAATNEGAESSAEGFLRRGSHDISVQELRVAERRSPRRHEVRLGSGVYWPGESIRSWSRIGERS